MGYVVVAGGGSAGVGAAWRAALCGAQVLLAEPGPILGGTSTLGGVHCWEPGIASPGLNRLLYRRMCIRPMSAGCGEQLRFSQAGRMNLHRLNDSLEYESTLRRRGAHRHARVFFEPAAMHSAMYDLLHEAGAKVWLNAAVVGAETVGERVTDVCIADLATGEQECVRADMLVDCTGDAVICRRLGAETLFGEDAHSDFGEQSAPQQRSDAVNGVSLLFRAAPDACAHLHGVPDWVRDTGAYNWIRKTQPCSHVTVYPNGDRCYNPCPLMEGREYWALPPGERMRECMARVYVLWEYLQNECEGHMGWRIREIAPRVGVREGYRVRALNMLTEQAARSGMVGADSIALADHIFDTHGSGGTADCAENGGFYGVPMGSLIVPQYGNLLVAGRCAGMSHIAASATRLSRTMMDLGEAAGALAALGGDARETRPENVRSAIGFGRYLEWAEQVYPHIGI